VAEWKANGNGERVRNRFLRDDYKLLQAVELKQYTLHVLKQVLESVIRKREVTDGGFVG